MANSYKKIEIRETKLNKLVILILLILVMISTFLIDSFETNKFLSQMRFRKITFGTMMRSRLGSNVLLGKSLYDTYAHNTTLVMPGIEIMYKKEFYHKYRLSSARVYYHSYPIKVRHGNYNCFLKKQEFDLLIRKAGFSVKSNLFTYYFVKSDDDEMAFFIYEDNVVIAPMRWGHVEDT